MAKPKDSDKQTAPDVAPTAPTQIALPAPASEAQTITAAELTTPLAAAMPEATAGAHESPGTDAGPELRDAAGTVFDPAVHKVAANGTPMVNKNGNYYSKSLGRAPDSKPKKPVFAGGFAGSEATNLAVMLDLPPGEDRYTGLAEMYLRVAYGPLAAMLSDEVRPTDEEHKDLKSSLAAWLRTMKHKEFSPGFAFGLCASGIFMSKLAKPTVKEKWDLLLVRARQLWARWTTRPAPRPFARPAAPQPETPKA